MIIRSITDIGNDRNQNDDSCYYDENKGIMVMADGMGGYAGGKIASSVAVSIFHDHYMGVTEETYKQNLTDLFLMCNEEILTKAKQNRNYREMGTTLTAFCFDEKHYYIGHIGDSRAYLLRNNSLTQLTDDHNMVSVLLKSGQITKKTAKHHPGKSMLTKVVGRQPLCEIDFYMGELEKNDVFLLCTDGISGCLDHKKIAGIIKNNINLEHTLNTLVKKVLDGKGTDNITAILAKNC